MLNLSIACFMFHIVRWKDNDQKPYLLLEFCRDLVFVNNLLCNMAIVYSLGFILDYKGLKKDRNQCNIHPPGGKFILWAILKEFKSGSSVIPQRKLRTKFLIQAKFILCSSKIYATTSSNLILYFSYDFI